jgi:hypothetical protein
MQTFLMVKDQLYRNSTVHSLPEVPKVYTLPVLVF